MFVTDAFGQGNKPRPNVAGRYLGAGSLEAARAIGEAYLTQINVERTDEAILEAARGTSALISRAPDDTAAVVALVERVRRDFRAARVVSVGGWVLSQTEVELCVLTFALPSRVIRVK